MNIESCFFYLRKVSFIFVILLFSAFISFAADDLFSGMDQNKDNRISRQEYQSYMSKKFDRLDANHDGVLTGDELRLGDQRFVKDFLAICDQNQDGKILRKEYDEAVSKQFSTLDKNNDGYIDKNEWKIFQSSRNKSGFVLFTF